MERVVIPIVGGYNVERDVYIDGQDSINLYPVPSEINKEKAVLVPASGFEFGEEIGTGLTKVRAQIAFKDKEYVVVDDEVFEIDSLGVQTNIGTLNTVSGYVGIVPGKTQIMFVDNVDGYYIDISAPAITVIAFGFAIDPIDCTFIDGYFLAADSASNFVYFSALNDPTTWSSADNFPLEGKADVLNGLRVLKNRVYVFGKFYTEIRYDSGAIDLPFVKDRNAFFEHGVAAPKTIQVGFELMFYLGRNTEGPTGFYMAQGLSNPQKISSPAVDLFLQNLADFTDAESILYRENGLTFYQTSFSTDDKTIVYVVETGIWHRLMTHDEKRHPATSHAFFNNKHYIGMYNTPFLYEMSWKFLTYNGELIRCIRRMPPFYDKNDRRIGIEKYEIESIPGIPEYWQVRNIAEATMTPIDSQLQALVTSNNHTKVILYVSRDGGRTFPIVKPVDFSQMGEYMARLVWRRIGCRNARRIVLMVEYPYKTHFYILGSSAVMELKDT